MKDVIVEHLIRNSFIRSSHLGFTAGRSCLTNLLEYMEELTNLVDMFYLQSSNIPTVENVLARGSTGVGSVVTPRYVLKCKSS